MKPGNVAKIIAAFFWALMGLVFIATGWSHFQGNPSVSVNGEPANVQFAIGYTVAGVLFALEAVLTFFRKKLALVLSIPVALFAAVAIFDQLNHFVHGSMITANYLIMYGAMFLVSILTIAVVVSAQKGADPKNA